MQDTPTVRTRFAHSPPPVLLRRAIEHRETRSSAFITYHSQRGREQPLTCRLQPIVANLTAKIRGQCVEPWARRQRFARARLIAPLLKLLPQLFDSEPSKMLPHIAHQLEQRLRCGDAPHLKLLPLRLSTSLLFGLLSLDFAQSRCSCITAEHFISAGAARVGIVGCNGGDGLATAGIAGTTRAPWSTGTNAA